MQKDYNTSGRFMKSYYTSALILLTVLAFVLSPTSVHAQYHFGKNKVQYTEFDWQVMSTEHFRIYFYKEEAEIAGVAARAAEDAYRPLAAKFNHEIIKPIPLIIYSSPGYFSETNVISGMLSESVGGFTEFLKGRVVLPFNGSYHDFLHVINHELVHVFQISKLEHTVNRQASVQHSSPPLWFTEGQAEFWSKEWDTEADMVVKDMVLSNRLPTIENLYVVQGTFYMYKLGESLCTFIDSTYGSDKLALLNENWTKGRTFDEIVKVTLGDNLEQLSKKWHYSLKKKYYPEMDSMALPKMESEQISGRGFAVKGVPITWDDGEGNTEWIVFMANRMGYSGLYMKPRGEGGDVKTLVKGERSPAYESLYLLRSGIDANNEGKVVFSSKNKGSDVLNIYDLNKEEVTRRYEMDGIVACRSPRFSPDGETIVFTGFQKSGYSDIYVLDISTGLCKPLTNDNYYDIDPAFSKDGATIYFASNRSVDGPTGATNIFKLDTLAGSEPAQLTFGNFEDRTPEPTSRGVFFSSNREGSFNLFLLGANSEMTRQSVYATGAFDPRLTEDGKTLVYTGYQEMTYQVYQMELLEEPKAVEHNIVASTHTWEPLRIDSSYSRASIKYDADYSFDIAQSSVGYDPVYGSTGGLQMAVSDILGNKAYYFLLNNTADTKDNFLTSFNLGITHVNKEKRLNWGVGLYHLYDEFYNDLDFYYTERQAGGLALLSYPLSKFNRFDFVTFARYSLKDRRYGLRDSEGFLVTNSLSLVYDNSLWDISGPIEGRRYNVTLSLTSSLNEGRNYNRSGSADFRHYVRLGRYSAFANRIYAYSSTGPEPQRVYLGGSWSFRGFDRRHFYNRNVMFTSNELRFPLIDDLFIGLPIGGLGFQAIRGAIFADVGSAWDDDFDRLYGSFGVGIRVSLGYLAMLRFDFSRTTDFKSISPKTDFDFFFGWNF